MRLHNRYHIWIMLISLALITLACLPIQPVATQVPPVQPTPVSQIPGPTRVPQAPSTPNIGLGYLIKATVQINGDKTQDGELIPVYSGSGTIISSTGLILTNAHIASPASQGHPYQEPDKLEIALMDQEDQAPVPSYYAVVKAVDGYMDLAVLQITSTLDGADVDPSSLNLPFVPMGNSDDLFLGQHLNIFGFPGNEPDIITLIDGMIAGFTPEEGLGDRAWIHTDTWSMVRGNSGGLAADDAGFIIGIPTIVVLGPANCLDFIVDTNGDGVVGGDDTCIPIGGYTDELRPVNLALPLIKAAESGEIYVSPFVVVPPPSPGSESFGVITWYTGTGLSGCQPKDQVNAFPSGTTAIAAAWSFNGMTEGEPWAVEWKLNGDVIYTSQYSWFSLNQGNTFLCFYNTKGLPDGNYHIELNAGQYGKLLTQSDVVVGGGPNPATIPSP